jgi:hypothetical protein
MLRSIIFCGFLAIASPALAADREFDFSTSPTNQPPKGFRSAVTGLGQPGDWRIILDEVPSALGPIGPASPKPPLRPVVAQLAREREDEHFPVLIFDDEVYGDFTFTTRFKTVAGDLEQMAGVAFRIQDEKNYYVVRASSKGSTFRFYKIEKGLRGKPVGPEVEVRTGVWHELSVQCHGNKFHCLLDGKASTGELTDGENPYMAGKIGFWTKSDSVSYFADARITYTPREPLIRTVVKDVLKHYPRLLELKIFGTLRSQTEPGLVASNDDQGLGQPLGDAEREVLTKGVIYAGKSKSTYTVTLPVRDRNGDVIAAARVVMRSFPGEVEQTAVSRALPIAKAIEERLRSAKDLTE